METRTPGQTTELTQRPLAELEAMAEREPHQVSRECQQMPRGKEGLKLFLLGIAIESAEDDLQQAKQFQKDAVDHGVMSGDWELIERAKAREGSIKRRQSQIRNRQVEG